MNNIRLNNGIDIPQLGLGVFQTPDGEQTENAVIWAMEAGYRHVDTAKIYGNEKSVGTGLKKSGVKREDVFLTTKLWNEDIRQGRTLQAFEKSLDLLQTDYVDLYLIHWPANGYEQAWADMEKLYNQKKIRAIGVSNFQEHHLETLASKSGIVPAVNQIESHPYFNNQPLIDYCLKCNIAVEVWSPLGGTGGTLLNDDLLSGLARKYGKTPAQIVIRWDIQRGIVVLPKSTHKERIVSNLDVYDFELSREDMLVMQEMNRDTRVGPNPDDFDF